MTKGDAPKTRKYRHIFLDAEGTLYVPRGGRSRWEFWADPTPDAALAFFELDRGVPEVLMKLREQADTICLVSRNSDTILGALLGRFGIGQFFDNIMLNGNKGRQIERYLSEHGFRKEDSLMVGDMPTLDFYPVMKKGIDAILVDREYNRWVKAERIKGLYELPAWLKIADLSEEIERGRVRNSTLDEYLARGEERWQTPKTKTLMAVPGA